MFSYTCDGCQQTVRGSCKTCLQHLLAMSNANVGDILVAMPYSGVARRLMIGYKYRNHREVGAMFSACVVQRLSNDCSVNDVGMHVDMVTWVPTTRQRRALRGHDQAERIARSIAQQLGLPVRKLLVKHVNDHQTGKSRAQRLEGHALVARTMKQPMRVLLVDDVVTTGTTLHGARDALIRAGAQCVVGVAVAATPAPGLRR